MAARQKVCDEVLIEQEVADTESETSITYGEIEEIIDKVEQDFKLFENFRQIRDRPPPADHYFNYKKPTKPTHMGRTLIEEIHEELRLSLPNKKVYVSAYEQRPDLMRAVIVGPQGTPYSHALFCFDIRLPSNYPARPPELYYHSYGRSLNPNFDKNGKVCFTALNADINGKSNPKPFGMLQVLTTIQDSVLNVDPHLNREGYNKNVLKETWNTMLCMLKSPPMDFEVLVAGHFRIHAHRILMHFKSHMDSVDETMIKLLYQLIRAFEANGTYCKHHYDQNFRYQLANLAKIDEKKADNSSLLSKLLNI